MSQLLRATALAAALCTVMYAGGLMSAAPAQVKGKKEPKAEIGLTEVYKAKDGWRFRIKNPEGKSIAIGTVGHEKKEDALKTLELVKSTLAKGKVEVLKE